MGQLNEMRSLLRYNAGEISIFHTNTISVDQLTEVRSFWHYCASTNIMQKKISGRGFAKSQMKSRLDERFLDGVFKEHRAGKTTSLPFKNIQRNTSPKAAMLNPGP